MNHSENVQKFYDQNSKRFLKFGDHDMTKCIHQPIWKEHSFSKAEALHYPHTEIQQWILKLQGRTSDNTGIADFGSGVGASIKYLADLNLDKEFYAITLSRAQHEVAEGWLKDYSNIHCINDNYLEAPLPSLNLIFQIESYNHCDNRKALIAKVKQHLTPNGYWIIFDDFVNEEFIDHKYVKQYREGWFLNILESYQAFEADCQSQNFEIVLNKDLSPYIKLGRPRDKWIVAFSPFIRLASNINQYAKSWYGGMARQKCLKMKMINYRMIVLRNMNE